MSGTSRLVAPLVNNERDGFMRQRFHRDRTAYDPNNLVADSGQNGTIKIWGATPLPEKP